jgi:leader peptidase (prepilin peptidase)/N-methyltransferase
MEEYHSWLAHVPLLGYIEHRSLKIVRYELTITLFNFLVFLATWFVGGKLLLAGTPISVGITLMLWSVILTCWQVVFMTDIRHYIISDLVNAILFVTSLLLMLSVSFFTGQFLWGNLIVGAVTFGFFLLMAVLTGGMGGGDIKFIFSSGFIFGQLVLFVVFFVSIFGIIYKQIIVPIFKLGEGKQSPSDIKGKKTFAYGPFLVMSSLIVLIFASQFGTIVSMYLHIFTR